MQFAAHQVPHTLRSQSFLLYIQDPFYTFEILGSNNHFCGATSTLLKPINSFWGSGSFNLTDSVCHGLWCYFSTSRLIISSVQLQQHDFPRHIPLPPIHHYWRPPHAACSDLLFKPSIIPLSRTFLLNRLLRSCECLQLQELLSFCVIMLFCPLDSSSP